MAVLQSLISPWKRRGKKENKKYQRGIRIWSPRPSTNPTEKGLTLLSGQNIFNLENNIFQVQWLPAILIKIRIWASTLQVLLYFVSYLIRSPRFILSLHFIPGLQSAFYTWSAFYTRFAVRVLYLVDVLYPVRSPQSAVRSPRVILTASVSK